MEQIGVAVQVRYQRGQKRSVQGEDRRKRV